MKYARPPSSGNSGRVAPATRPVWVRSAHGRDGCRAVRGDAGDRVTKDSTVGIEIADPGGVTRGPCAHIPVHKGIQIGRDHVAEPASGVDRHGVRHSTMPRLVIVDRSAKYHFRSAITATCTARSGEVDRPSRLSDASGVRLVPTVVETGQYLDPVPVVLEDRGPARPLESVELTHVHARVLGPEGSGVGEPDDVGRPPGIQVGLGGGRPLLAATRGCQAMDSVHPNVVRRAPAATRLAARPRQPLRRWASRASRPVECHGATPPPPDPRTREGRGWWWSGSGSRP